MSIGVYTKNLVDIGTIFRPYSTGTQNLNYFFTKDSVDIGSLLQPWTFGTKTNTGVYTKDNIDIGTLYQTDYITGLSVKIYDGYFDPNTTTFFNGLNPTYTGSGVTDFTSINTATKGQIPLNNSRENYSVIWSGLFLPDFTGTWTFGLASDDASYLWIGANAVYGTNSTVANALINNAGLHAIKTITNTITLNAGQYYPFLLIFGEYTGNDNCTLYYSRNASANSYDFSGKFFSNN